jgi:pyruvate/2-oxoglutarate dehydrogenase complex dihydrolipoamide acyltransferase (E2) component
MTEADIILERDTANDESATIVAVVVASGSKVEADELLFEFENSKATQELRAPHGGILIHSLAVGQTVEFGVPIARIVGAEQALAAPAPSQPAAVQLGETKRELAPANPAASAPKDPPGPRFSREAVRLLEEFGIARSAFATGFVTSQRVKARAGGAAAATPEPSAKLPSAQRPNSLTISEPVERRKRTEITSLASGAGSTMLSVLGKTIGPLPVHREAGNIFADRITDLVIYEAARLMKKYPKLNAYYEDGKIHRHAVIHAGLAIDGGSRLVVYGVEHADRLDLSDLSRLIADAVARYMDNTLTASEMSRATFTVTDLSAEELDFVFPLLPSGQSCILGITRDSASVFRLFAGFDHRVTEGREVAQFLGELSTRLQSFASSIAAPPAALSCDYCHKTLAEAVTRSKDKGFLSVINGQGSKALCCASCWNGW